jgi:DNA-binding beta-propeller fold protein YncE
LDKPLPDSEASESSDLGDREKFVARGRSDSDPETEGPETLPDDAPAGDEGFSDEPIRSEEFPADEPVDNAAQSFQEYIVPETPPEIIKPRKSAGQWLGEGTEGITSFVFAGILLGLMPMWNGAIFVAAFAVLALLFVLFPQRRQMVALAIATAILALPQVIYLKTGGMPDPGYTLIGWGYTLTPRATVMQVVEYLGWIFGFKWLLIAIALIIGSSFQRRLFLAICSLIILTFCFQFSIEVMTNHKFLNLWVVIANLYVAYGLWFLWNLRIKVVGRTLAIVLTILITLSGFLDLYPFHTTDWGEVAYGNDALVKWVSENTPPDSVFLSARYTSHNILLAGRRLFYGHPYYAWGAGYDTHKRDMVYVRMLESTSPQEVLDLLHENGINYVAIDNNLRKNNESIKKLNEAIYEAYFPVVYDDKENKYGRMTIYQVPDELGQPKAEVELPPEVPRAPVNTSEAVPAFKGGEGNTPGKFSKPRGIAADAKGNIYVADAGNARVQKFDQDGKFVSIIGDPGEREGKIKEPNGIGVDTDGNVYVTDAGNHKFLKYGPDGVFVKEYNGPDSGFYGPRDLAVGPNRQVYIVDQGRTRIARFQPATEQFSAVWGTAGPGDGEFKDATGIAVGDNMVFVADLGNGRIQVFDLEGKFIREWPIPAWTRSSSEFPDVVVDEQTKTVYVTSGPTNEVLAFDENGSPLKGFNPQDDKLDNPSSLAISESGKKRWLLVLNSGGNARVSRFELEPPKTAAK